MSGAVQVIGPPASTNKFYQPELDVVRFIAFLAVFCHHTLPAVTHNAGGLVGIATNACSFGLPLFFILSAYLIGEILLREKELFKAVNMRSFYTRRILRIWPLYFFGLILGALYAVFVAHHKHDLILLGAFAAMVGNWAMILWATANPMAPLWSISVEEQFYLICPLAITTLSRRGLAWFSSALIALSCSILFLLGHLHSAVDSRVWFSNFVQFQMFGAGLLLCLYIKRHGTKCPGWVRLFCLLIAPCLWYAACAVFDVKRPHVFAKSGMDLVLGYFCITVGCVLILRGALGVSRKFAPKWLAWLGKVSFGLYVYHLLVATLLKRIIPNQVEWFFVSLIVTIGVAAASYQWLESPFLRIKKRYEVIAG